jgi:membrane protease YdiL (CAAX protease family)
MIRTLSPMSLLHDREVWAVLVAIVLSNVAFVYAVSEGVIETRYYHLGRFLLLGAVLALGVFAFRGWRAPFELLKPLTVWRFNPAWFVLALLWPPAMAALALVGKGLVLGTGLSEVTARFDVALNPLVLKGVVVGAFVGEIVWVGYALSRFGRSTTVFTSALIVGMFWAAWWVPIVVIGIGVIPGLPIWGLFLGQTAMAVMCGFVYSHTRSGWVVFVLQTSANSAMLIFPVSPHSGGVPTYLAFGVVYLVASTLLYLKFGPRPLFQRRSAGLM